MDMAEHLDRNALDANGSDANGSEVNGSEANGSEANSSDGNGQGYEPRPASPGLLDAQPAPRRVVGIGASAGGLEALELFFKNMSPESGMCFVVIQHLSPDFKSVMDELLARHTAMPIHRTEDGTLIEPDSVYLLPPRKNMVIEGNRLRLIDQQPRHGVNLPLDIFLESLAEDQGDRAVAIVLSGTGSDGARGIRRIKEAGGIVLVQDENSAKFDGMPRAAVATGMADFVLPPDEMPGQLLRLVQHPFAASDAKLPVILRETTKLEEIIRILRKGNGIDFTHYKPTTVCRRIERRMGINHVEDVDDYIGLLHDSSGECKALAKDLLIGVTQFFRDRQAWSLLRTHVVPRLIQEVRRDDTIRIWTPACSTGEEAYTVGMLIRDALDDAGQDRDVKIFATDIDTSAIEMASNGVYAETIAADIEPDWLARFFVRRGDSFHVKKTLRELVIFASHNLTKDPPFTKVDLISCRNLLIYIQPAMQQRLLSLFHFALNANGYLFLGASESLGDTTSAFRPVFEKEKIFQKNADIVSPALAQMGRQDMPSRLRAPLFSPDVPGRVDAGDPPVQRAYEYLTEMFAPPAALVSEHFDVLHTVGDVSQYIRLPEGAFTSEITRMVAGDLRIALSTALHRAAKQKEQVTYRDVRVKLGELEQIVDLRVQPLTDRRSNREMYLVLFQPQCEPAPARAVGELYDESSQVSQRIADLESELQQSKENLQATIEELETSNEELQSTNEELLASNEELQSTNEELHSVNEELYTVNAEYQSKIEELRRVSNDFENLLSSTQIGVVFLGKDLRIRRFTPAACAFVNIVEHDVGRPIDHFTNKIQDSDLLMHIRRVIETGQSFSREVEGESGLWLFMRILPFRTSDNEVDGAVLTFLDITELRESRTDLARLAAIVEYSSDAIIALDLEGRIVHWNRGAEVLYGYTAAEVVGQVASMLAPAESNDYPRLLQTIRDNEAVPAFEAVRKTKTGRLIHVLLSVSPIRDRAGKVIGASTIAHDISDRKRAEEVLQALTDQLKSSNEELNEFASIASHDLQEPLRTIGGYCQLLSQELGGQSAGVAREHIDRINDAVRQLQDRIADLLRFSRVSAHEIAMAPVDTNALIDRVVGNLASIIAETQAAVTHDGLPQVWGSEALLEQLFQNLIENGLKYRGETPPRIHVFATQAELGWCFCVRDNGVGIPAEHRERVFQPFRRLPGQSATNGTGMGLAIAKRIVERHRGRLWLESEPGQGSQFYFTIPEEM